MHQHVVLRTFLMQWESIVVMCLILNSSLGSCQVYFLRYAHKIYMVYRISALSLQGCCDVDMANNLDAWKPTSGHAITAADGAVSCCSTLLKMVYSEYYQS
jgi:hypothetical protein